MGFFPDNFKDILAQQLVDAHNRTARVEAHYLASHVPAHLIGAKTGLVHAASILVWARLAELAGVPHIPVEVVAEIPMTAVWGIIDHQPDKVDAEATAEFFKANAYAARGGYWRSEYCAGAQVKYAMGSGAELPELLLLDLDDPRLIDMHCAVPSLTIVGRPRLTPVRVNGYPIEFRVFNNTTADNSAVSFYYPQAGEFPITPDLESAMTQAQEWGMKLHTLRAELGLIPWLPEMEFENDIIGSTVDFMLTEEMGLVLVDAGPGAGYGAHPCCFIDQPIVGRRWQLAEGVTLR